MKKKEGWLDGIRAFNERYAQMLNFNEGQRIWFGGIVAVIGMAVALLTPDAIAGFLVFLLGVFLMV